MINNEIDLKEFKLSFNKTINVYYMSLCHDKININIMQSIFPSSLYLLK